MLRLEVNYIKAFRLAKGMTRVALADVMEIDRLTVWRWETGKTIPPWQALRRLAAVLHTTPLALFPTLNEPDEVIMNTKTLSAVCIAEE